MTNDSWLAECRWPLISARRLGTFEASGIDKKTVPDEPLVRMVNYTNVYGNTSARIDGNGELMTVSTSPDRARRYSLQFGDVLFTPSSETADEVGAAAVVTTDLPDTVFSYHLIRFRSTGRLDPDFCRFAFNSPPIQHQLVKRAKGTTRQILIRDDFNEMLVPVPSIPAQRAIATFLDRKTAALDALIEKKHKLLELLAEKRSALIKQAVSKGLDLNVPMKDSGIPWIGEIPAHWDVRPARWLADRIKTGGTPPTVEDAYYRDGTVPWFAPNSFDAATIQLGQPKALLNRSAVTARVVPKFREGAVLVVGIGATLGKVALLHEEGSANQQILALEFDPRRMIPQYAAYQFKYREGVFLDRALFTTLPIMNQHDIGCYHVICPPLSEQGSIVAWVDSELSRLSRVGTLVDQLTKKLQEYRQSLITAAVTGQMNIPEEPTP